MDLLYLYSPIKVIKDRAADVVSTYHHQCRTFRWDLVPGWIVGLIYEGDDINPYFDQIRTTKLKRLELLYHGHKYHKNPGIELDRFPVLEQIHGGHLQLMKSSATLRRIYSDTVWFPVSNNSFRTREIRKDEFPNLSVVSSDACMANLKFLARELILTNFDRDYIGIDSTTGVNPDLRSIHLRGNTERGPEPRLHVNIRSVPPGLKELKLTLVELIETSASSFAGLKKVTLSDVSGIDPSELRKFVPKVKVEKEFVGTA